MTCPKCGTHSEHIYIFARDARTHNVWYIERCSREPCGWNYDVWTTAEYHIRRDEANDAYNGRNPRPPDRGRMFGL